MPESLIAEKEPRRVTDTCEASFLLPVARY